MKIRGNTVGTPLSVEKIAEELGTLRVNLNYGYEDSEEGFAIASHNLAQIEEHFNKGGVVVGETQDWKVPLHSIQTHLTYGRVASFVFHDDRNLSDMHYFIDERGLVHPEESSFDHSAAFEHIWSKLGDIDSAMDELHTYAQGLIDGGADV